MDVDKLNWTLLRSFVAVIDAGSLLGAARRLGTHQPTVSRHIAELEAQLGVPLFERTGRGLSPTRVGTAIVEPARQMASAAAAICRTPADLTTGLRGSVRISTSQIVGSYLMPPCLGLLRAHHPSIDIDLTTTQQLSNLLRRDADIAVRMLRPAQASIVARRIGEMPMGCFAAGSYLKRRPPPSRLRELAEHDLVGLDQDDAVLRGLAAAGLELDRSAFAVRTDDQGAYTRLVEQGAGIGFLPLCVAARLHDLQPVLPRIAVPPLTVWLAVHREIRGNPVIRTVFDLLAAELPRLLSPPRRTTTARPA